MTESFKKTSLNEGSDLLKIFNRLTSNAENVGKLSECD